MQVTVASSQPHRIDRVQTLIMSGTRGYPLCDLAHPVIIVNPSARLYRWEPIIHHGAVPFLIRVNNVEALSEWSLSANYSRGTGQRRTSRPLHM